MHAQAEIRAVTYEAEPVFRSAHAALVFALNFSHGTLKKSALAQASGGGGSGRGLGGLDGAAQSGMILAELQQLSALRRSVLIAKYASPSAPCACRSSCCRGWRENPQWSEAINYLTEYVLVAGLTGTVSHFRLRRSLVSRYFGQGATFLTIASSCGVDRHTASGYNKRIVERFRDEQRHALYEIEGLLKQAGIVEA